MHTCLQEECRTINQSGSCTLRPLRLLYCCFPLNRRQITSDITSSPLFATATQKRTSKGLAWRLNKSACNSGNVQCPSTSERALLLGLRARKTPFCRYFLCHRYICITTTVQSVVCYGISSPRLRRYDLWQVSHHYAWQALSPA